MSNPIQQSSNNRYPNPPLNSQQLPNQYLTNYNSSMPIKLNQQRVTNSQGKQIAYIANPREQPSRVSNKNGSAAEGQEFRQSRQKQYTGNARSQLPTMTNEDVKHVEKQDLKMEQLKRKTQRGSKVAGIDESGHMFCGPIGWIVGCIIGLLILTALLLFGLGVIGGPINQSGSQNKPKVSSKQPNIAYIVDQVQTEKPIVDQVQTEKPILSSQPINSPPIAASSIQGKTSVSSIPSSPSTVSNKTPVSSTTSASTTSQNTANKL